MNHEWEIGSRVNCLVKIPIRCWDISRGLLLFAAPCTLGEVVILSTVLLRVYVFRDSPSNFYWNRFIFDRQGAKDKLAQFFETQCTYSGTNRQSIANAQDSIKMIRLIEVKNKKQCQWGVIHWHNSALHCSILNSMTNMKLNGKAKPS